MPGFLFDNFLQYANIRFRFLKVKNRRKWKRRMFPKKLGI